MASPLMSQRRDYVQKLLDQGVIFNHKLKVEIGLMFNSSHSAIHADLIYFSNLGNRFTIHISTGLKREIFERDGRACQYCETNDAGKFYIVEHVIPAAWGGIARPYNLVIACEKCNLAKGRSVWIPKNLDIITKNNPEWKDKILALAIRYDDHPTPPHQPRSTPPDSGTI